MSEKIKWPSKITVKDEKTGKRHTYIFKESYKYLDESGNLTYEKARYENKQADPPKTMRFKLPDNTWGLNGQKKILYGLPDVVNSTLAEPVAYCEGEKDRDRLASLGFIACTAGAAQDWQPKNKKYFQGRIIDLFYDNDEIGIKWRDIVANDLYSVASVVRIIDLPEDYKDISDFLDAGHSKKELLQIMERGRWFKPTVTSFPLTDAGNSERFAYMHKNLFRFCVEHNRWYWWDGYRWNVELGEEKANQSAIITARSIVDDAKDVFDKNEREKILKWAIASESAVRLRAMLSLAQTNRVIVCHAKDFNKHNYLLNCLSGTIDLRTTEISNHNPRDMINKLCPTKYISDAQNDVFDKVLNDCTGGSLPMKEFLQISCGYSAGGDTSEEKLFLIHGSPASSKSTFLEGIKTTLGDYAATADFETFLKRPQVGGVRNDIARLSDARFVVSIEVDEGKELAEGLVKMLTGGDTVTTRFLYKESFEFYPKFKLWLAANHAPKISDRDEAMWRRILRIPFDHSIPEDERDPAVKATLRNPDLAGPAILKWLVDGYQLWQAVGLCVPDIIKNATNIYRNEQDPLRDFFEDFCEFTPDGIVPVSVLRQRYSHWAKASGLKYPLGPQAFNHRLKDRGCEQKTRDVPNEFGTFKPTRCWIGISLHSDLLRNENEYNLCENGF
ncbi:MAG: hypothetical protein JW715_09285 [Sedimentisphaerales bacterium]|nr:hypothetical protein [Sedimentisphaerales bacterium]